MERQKEDVYEEAASAKGSDRLTMCGGDQIDSKANDGDDVSVVSELAKPCVQTAGLSRVSAWHNAYDCSH